MTGRSRSRHVRIVVVVVLLALGAWFGWDWLHDRWTHVYVADARIDAATVVLASRSAGWVVELPVGDGDWVRKGEVLAVIDQREMELRLAGLAARQERLQAEQARLAAERQMADRRTAGAVAEARARLAVAEADHRVARSAHALARSVHERSATLHQRNVSSIQTMEETRTAAELAGHRISSTAAEIEAARAALAAAEADRARLEVLDRDLDVLRARTRELEAQRDIARLERDDRVLRAAFDGVVSRTFVEVGEYVAPGSRLLLYHDPSKVWVALNVKETEIHRFGIGSKARVTVDAWPGRTFEGEVTRIGHAATSEFALLPTPNPSGNFTKITQRLPVRIAIEQDGDLLRPGMMVQAVITADGTGGNP